MKRIHIWILGLILGGALFGLSRTKKGKEITKTTITKSMTIAERIKSFFQKGIDQMKKDLGKKD